MTVSEFEKYYRQYYMPLCMYALRVTGDTEAARDAVHDAFAATWQRVAGSDGVADLRAYLYRVTRNAALRQLSAIPPAGGLSVPEISEEEIDMSERDAALWNAIDALPDRCREIFLMSKRDGMSNAEIAAELSISVKTVENQMTKALRSLRGHLGGRRDVFFLPFL